MRCHAPSVASTPREIVCIRVVAPRDAARAPFPRDQHIWENDCPCCLCLHPDYTGCRLECYTPTCIAFGITGEGQAEALRQESNRIGCGYGPPSLSFASQN